MLSARSKKALAIVGILLFLFACWSFYVYYHLFHDSLIDQGPAQTVKVHPGTGVSQLAQTLHQRKLLQHPYFFIEYAQFTGLSSQVRFGEYWIKPGMSAMDVLRNVTQSKGVVQHKMTFIEGWTFRDIRAALDQDSNVRHLTEGKTNAEIMTMIGHPNEHPEGRFFPNTYLFRWGNSDADVLKHAYNKMRDFLQAEWPKRARDAEVKTPYEALIIASLVEKETAINAERPLIAGVILKRLHIGMRLQVDPTVLYGLNKAYDEPITKKDLRSKTPYNTYTRYGLPPTPIDMPSGASIKATLHPEKSHYLYYVSRGDGSHQFSPTYKQHLKAIKRYQGRAKEKEIEKRDHEDSALLHYWRSHWETWLLFLGARV